MIKSVKEGKQHSSWITPNEPYEAAVATFVERVLTGPEAAKFLPAFQPFHDRVARSGLVNSLSQVVLKIASPGVPDFYQGSELWDLNLVDPDNRRPVDFAARRQALDRIDALLAQPAPERSAGIAALLEHWTGRRDQAPRHRRRPAAARRGAGAAARGRVPAARGRKHRRRARASRSRGSRPTAGAMIAIAPHLVSRLITAEHPVPLGDRWRTSRVHLPRSLAGLTYRDVFTGEDIRPVTAGENAWLFVGQALPTLSRLAVCWSLTVPGPLSAAVPD